MGADGSRRGHHVGGVEPAAEQECDRTTASVRPERMEEDVPERRPPDGRGDTTDVQVGGRDARTPPRDGRPRVGNGRARGIAAGSGQHPVGDEGTRGQRSHGRSGADDGERRDQLGGQGVGHNDALPDGAGQAQGKSHGREPLANQGTDPRERRPSDEVAQRQVRDPGRARGGTRRYEAAGSEDGCRAAAWGETQGRSSAGGTDTAGSAEDGNGNRGQCGGRARVGTDRGSGAPGRREPQRRVGSRGRLPARPVPGVVTRTAQRVVADTPLVCNSQSAGGGPVGHGRHRQDDRRVARVGEGNPQLLAEDGAVRGLE